MDKVFIIAEAGVNHNGSLENALRLVDMAKECGADAVKFQTFKAHECAVSITEKVDYQKENTPDVNESQYDMLRKLELPFEDFRKIQAHCNKRGILFISTPDGEESLNCLIELDIPIIKIGSTEITNFHFLKSIGRTGKDIILSTGMSYLGEVERAVDAIRSAGNSNITLMHCTTDYPTKDDEANLLAITTLKNVFMFNVGYSDHTDGSEAAVMAAALGASCIEKHITLDRDMDGPDHKASMNESMFKKYVETIRKAEKMLGDGIKRPSKSELALINNVRRCLVAKRNIEKGVSVTPEDLAFKRAGAGLSLDFEGYIVGRVARREIAEESIIHFDDFFRSESTDTI